MVDEETIKVTTTNVLIKGSGDELALGVIVAGDGDAEGALAHVDEHDLDSLIRVLSGLPDLRSVVESN